MSTFNPLPSPAGGGLPSRVWLFSLNWVGICGISGMGPFPKSLGRAVIFCEYLLLTKSAVLSARCGRSLGTSPRFCLDRLESVDGRPVFCMEGAGMPVPAGMGALICRGALMVGGPPFFLSLSPRFLRREIPFDFSFSDILPARAVFTGQSSGGRVWEVLLGACSSKRRIRRRTWGRGRQR